MNEKKLNLRIITPRGVKFAKKADMIIMRCIDGDLGIMPGHEPVSTVLGDGILRIFMGKEELKLAVFGGVALIENDTVKILTTIAQGANEIDVTRAEIDRREVEQLINEKTSDLRMKSNQILLRQALVRIEVSSYLDTDDEYEN